MNLLSLIPFFMTYGGCNGNGNGNGGSGGRGSGDCKESMHGGPGARAQAWAAATATAAETEGCRASATIRSRRCSSVEDFRSSPPRLTPPPPPSPRGRVRFHHQIKVVLVASRGEMSSVKDDVWWGERDYYDFRCAGPCLLLLMLVLVVLVLVFVMLAVVLVAVVVLRLLLL